MDIQLGVACGRCDRYSVLGSEACVCGHLLAIGGPLPAKAPEAGPPAPVAPSAVEAGPPAPIAAKAGAEVPPSVLYDKDGLKPRWVPSAGPPPRPGPSGGARGKEASSSRPRSTRSTLRAQDSESAVSSDGAAEDGVSARGRSAPGVKSAEPSLEELMEQAKNYVCRSCSTPVPLSHKFCGRCGAAIPPEILNARTQFFGQLQMPGKAKLILIRGEGIEGLSYQLNAEQHVVGRNGQLVFPDDPYVSPRHANLFYRNGKLFVRDEGSLNGVFWRVRGSVDLAPGDLFLAGEQLFRVEGSPRPNDGPAPDGTYFYTSPKHQTQFKISQVLEGGALGMAVCARGTSLQIGREGADLNFAADLYMSASHCKLDESAGKITLTDLNSRNGTYVRLKAEKELGSGDYLFIGRKLLRVEITPS
jgi:pSer/pThr/pTyr-binding forkhead associated (FHA) protein